MKYADVTLGRVEAVWNILGGEEGASHLLAGMSEVVLRTHVIDCAAAPDVPETWQVDEHQEGGLLEWDLGKVQLYLDAVQRGRKPVTGNQLREKLKGKPVLNANVLDYLFKHPRLIPESWKKDEQGQPLYIYFWGTTYWSLGERFVRFLYWNDGRWGWNSSWLGMEWSDYSPAAILTS